MIISRTPFRISFFGGGTDYPVYYRENGGAVLVTSINRYCWITLRRLPPFFHYRHRIVYSRHELVEEIDQIVHPSVRECLRHMDIQEGLEIHHDGDLPARTGLGSSSSFTVGLLKALYAFKGRMITKLDLAEAAIHVEQQMIQENVGSQDQTIAAFGGLHVIHFGDDWDRHIQVEQLCFKRGRTETLEDHLMLFFTGFARNASEVAAEQIRQTPNRKRELSEMHSMVSEATNILLKGGDIRDFGRLLHESWLLKKSLTNIISNSTIDEIYQKAMDAGAIGGKLLGAGGGGFILFFVEPDRQSSVKEALGLSHVPIRFEYSGSQIIFYEPDNE